MARYCEYCGSSLGLNDRVCPGCGAPVPAGSAAVPAAELHRSSMPLTIEELKAFCREKNMPLAQMRFFIGQDTPDARAFGIFRDYDGSYVVYKNKADGSRSIRYQGPDEAFAVREIYLKLRDETARRQNPLGTAQIVRSNNNTRKKHSIITPILAIVAALLLTSMLLSTNAKKPFNGYYFYDNNYYYHQNDDWYYYSNSVFEWIPIGTVDEELEDHYEDYFSSQEYYDDYGIESFSDTSQQASDSKDEGDDSDSWDYDFDSWDAGDTDWDSDW